MRIIPGKTSRRYTSLAVGALITAVAACSPGSDRDTASGDTAAVPSGAAAGGAAPAAAGATGSDSMAGMDHSNMPGMGGMAMMTPVGGASGNPDQDFLRAMSDHHKGLIAMAHETIEKEGQLASKDDARKLDRKQDAQLDTMVTMLERDFKDDYKPSIMPDNQAMVDSLKRQSGTAFDRVFYQNVVKHHQQAVEMTDHYLPQLKRAEIKRMAERMREENRREAEEFQRKIAKS